MTNTLTAIDSVKNINGNYYINIDEDKFDLQSSQNLAFTCVNLLIKDDIKKIILNFEKINSITTSGIGRLLDIYYHLSYCNNLKMYIYNVNDDIQECFKTVMVDTILNIVDENNSLLWN